jgi:hypothetical protein
VRCKERHAHDITYCARIIDGVLDALPDSTDVLDHWTSEGAVVPDHSPVFVGEDDIEEEEVMFGVATIPQHMASADLVSPPRKSVAEIDLSKED